MEVLICNGDESMFVHELRGVVFVTWVAAEHKDRACHFPASLAAEWAKLITDMTGVQCTFKALPRRGML